jgi:PleD family two-component response regulator
MLFSRARGGEMSKNIAIVEDDVDFGDMITSRLRRAGYACILISDSEKAFPVIKNKKPDMVILDVMMPKVSGYELCRRIRRDPLIFTTPVLMLSALGGEPEVEHAIEQGADDYIVKPLDVGVLFSKIKALFEKQAKIIQENPLTQMHGGEYIKKIISNKLFREEQIAVCYFTLTNFAPYVKAYGPEKRDEAIKLVADILREVTNDSGVYECGLGHLGGPDFMALLSIKDSDRFCSEAVARLKQRRGGLYGKIDLERGYIQPNSADGAAAQFPLMSLVVGVTTNESIRFRDSGQMLKVAGEVNKRAQQKHENEQIEVLREGILL